MRVSRLIVAVIVLAGSWFVWDAGKGGPAPPLPVSPAGPPQAAPSQVSPAEVTTEPGTVLSGRLSQDAGTASPSVPRSVRLPQDSDNARQIAEAWAKSGWQLVEAGEHVRAIQAFREAAKLATDEASLYVGIGLCLHRLSRDDEAMNALEQAIRFDPDVGRAHALLGEIHERREEISAALRHYNIAFRQDPSDVETQERLLDVRRQARYEGRRDRLFSAHFMVNYEEGAANRAVAYELADRLEAAYEEVGRQFSYFPSGAFTVVLYPAGGFRAATLSPRWAHGLFDGTIHVAIEAVRQTPESVGRLLIHEYTHAVVHQLGGGHAPAWLSEGLALYSEGGAKLWPGGWRSDPADGVPLGALRGSFLGLSPRAAADAYEQSLGATQALIQRYGMGRVRQFLETLPHMPDFPRAFEAVFQERYSEFEMTWNASRPGKRV